MRDTIPAIKQFFRFCGVGSINTIVSLAVIFLLSEVFNFHYIASNVCGYLVGLLLGFVLHKTLTFKNKSKETRKQFAQFVMIFIIAYLIQLASLAILVDILGLFEFASQILAAGIYTIINFVGNKIFTFKANNE